MTATLQTAVLTESWHTGRYVLARCYHTMKNPHNEEPKRAQDVLLYRGSVDGIPASPSAFLFPQFFTQLPHRILVVFDRRNSLRHFSPLSASASWCSLWKGTSLCRSATDTGTFARYDASVTRRAAIFKSSQVSRPLNGSAVTGRLQFVTTLDVTRHSRFQRNCVIFAKLTTALRSNHVTWFYKSIS